MRLAFALAAAGAAAAFLPGAAEARAARCVVVSNGMPTYRGPCNFIPDGGGSFTIAPPRGRLFPGDVTGISVTLEETGVAQVYGLTPRGVASRWGTAVRSRRDRACWNGPDFSICAY
ncbi:MAG: hypothetical protein QOI38_2787 [Sphingomonadales bacterium]|jgi:hypothetical protein|nr:hypothetical protein [Sphingomonadales bacterium]